MKEIKKRIGILRGGENNYENSLQKGGELISYILENLSDRWQVVDIFVDKNNIWHLAGKEIKPADLINKVDLVWNIAQPGFSNVLRSFSVPVMGTDFFASFIGESRNLLEEHMKQIGVKMPRHLVIPVYQKDFDGEEYKYIIKKAKEVHEKFSAPWIIKSFSNNLNMGIHLAKTFPELEEAIEDGIKHKESILVEEFISGKNVSLHTTSNFRNEEVYSLPPVEHRDEYFIVPGNFAISEKEKLINLAKDLHKHLHVKHYLKSNFVLHPKRGIFLTSVEFLPDLKDKSHFHKTCESVGTKAHNIIEHILESVL